MGNPPAKPKIYHITHVDNLGSIIADGTLFSDAVMIRRGGPNAEIGMSRIKKQRLMRRVDCYPNTAVGDYVPFYFCPRSVMLSFYYYNNRPEITYRGGQEPIAHLQFDLHEMVEWAEAQSRRWAFTLSNAAAHYTEFRAQLGSLSELDWRAIAATTWSGRGVDPDIKEQKQAEFLVYESVPWALVRQVGVMTNTMLAQVDSLLTASDHIPSCRIERGWYY